jgi:hypothetical protein
VYYVDASARKFDETYRGEPSVTIWYDRKAHWKPARKRRSDSVGTKCSFSGLLLWSTQSRCGIQPIENRSDQFTTRRVHIYIRQKVSAPASAFRLGWRFDSIRAHARLAAASPARDPIGGAVNEVKDISTARKSAPLRCAPGAALYFLVNSMRRLAALPSSVVLSAIGRSAP